MVQWINPITDRTQADVDRAKYLSSIPFADMTASEKAEWNSGLKGSLNISDLQRIETNIHVLSDVFELGLTTYEDDIPVLPRMAYFNNLRSNVQAIRNASITYDDTPQVPQMPINTFGKINDIERILKDIHTILNNNFFIESVDEFDSGFEVGLVL